jgi:hypothetical protein
VSAAPRYGAPPSGELPLLVGGKPCLWQAWTGRNELPGYLRLCMESVRRHNADDFTVCTVTSDNVRDYLPDLHPAYELLSYVHRADYLRAELLHRYGGMYCDADTICFRGLGRHYARIAEHDLVTYDGSPWGEIFGVGVFGPTRRGSLLTAGWTGRLREVLDRRHDDLQRARREDPDEGRDCLGWSEVLLDLLSPLGAGLAAEGRLSFLPVGLDRFVAASERFAAGELFSPGPLQVGDEVDLVILNNAYYPADFKALSAGEVLGLDLGIASLLRQALDLGPG